MKFFIENSIINEIDSKKRIDYYNEYFLKLYDTIQNNFEIYVSFRTDNYVTSINPKNVYDTPTGLYAYPLSLSEKKEFLKKFRETFSNDSVDTRELFVENSIFPFIPSTSKHINLYEEKSSDGILNTMLDSMKFFKENQEKIENLFYKIYGDNQKRKFPKTEKEIKNFIEMTAPDYFKSEVEYRSPLSLLYLFMYVMSWGNMTKLRNMFLSIGVKAIVDYGSGTIHPNEKTQAVFFTPKKTLNMFGQIDKLNNNMESYKGIINLSNKGLVFIPSEYRIKYRKHQKKIDLSGNKLDTFGFLEKFEAREIDLSHNYFRVLPDAQFKNLKKISFQDNRIYDINSVLKFLRNNQTQLKEINLKGNPIIKEKDFSKIIDLCKEYGIKLIY